MKEQILETYKKFPDKSNFVVSFENGKPTIFYSDNEGLKKGKFLQFIYKDYNFEFVQTTKNEILSKLEDIMTEESETSEQINENIDIDTEDILSASYEDAPIIKLVNSIIISATKKGASDIHIEGTNKFLQIKFRIDGQLQLIKTLNKELQDSVIARIKVMSNLDVAETRKPQDGRINLKIGNRDVDIRVSIVPSIFGEKAVLRILEKKKNLLDLKQIGMPKNLLEQYEKQIKKPNGIILVTGPTGSGKTTTLYASLLELNDGTKNIMTIEDPVEYDIDGIVQVQVNPVVNLTFANALRTFLRQDPDIILVGEIRDEETAKAAIQASLTGHLVFSTLHTNDAATAVARLLEMDIEPFLIASSLNMVIAQRLVRKVCENCKRKIESDDSIKLYFPSLQFHYKGNGCEKCFYTGYSGRTPIFEMLLINDEIRRLIIKKADAPAIREVAKKYGFKSLIEHGLDLIKKGVTSVEEVIAHTKES